MVTNNNGTPDMRDVGCEILKRSVLILLPLIFLFQLSGNGQQSAYDMAVLNYIMTYSPIAIQEMKIYRIPASITLAQGIFESNAGRSSLATEANNHFGIKCHKEWTGTTFTQDDETKNECFRKYDCAEESFRDHSWFLTQRDRYKQLFLLEITDYKGWAYGLKAAGYATNPDYPTLLIKTIENYSLYKFDNPEYTFTFPDSLQVKKDTILQIAKEERFRKLSDGPARHTIFTVNDLKLTMALKGDTWQKLSKLFKVSHKKLLAYNDLKPNAKLATGQIIFLEAKKKKAALSWYYIQSGETMYMVSQYYGIQLKYLYKLNGMKPGQPVKPETRLKLR
jgi:LysM repeat protein